MNSPEIKIDVKIGTSGYSYEDWRNHFYPINLAKSSFLEFYAQFFNAVEINSTYYTIPNQFTTKRMVEKTPENFCFIVKTHQETTHRRQENKTAIEQLVKAVQPMVDSGKFHGFLAQFPYSFKNNEANRKYLLQTRELLKDFPLFVEFRHISWINPAMYRFLKENNISYVNVDQPQLPGLLPPQAVVTTELGYVRFHGRNAKDWWNGEGSARYDYLYTRDELQEWMANIAQILQKTYRTYIFFNNHPRGQAVKNAKQMLELIQNQLNIFD